MKENTNTAPNIQLLRSYGCRTHRLPRAAYLARGYSHLTPTGVTHLRRIATFSILNFQFSITSTPLPPASGGDCPVGDVPPSCFRAFTLSCFRAFALSRLHAFASPILNLKSKKRMKKRVLFLLAALLCASTTFGQNKEVAVLKPRVIGGGTVSANDQLIISSSMKKAFTQIDGYEGYSRTSQTLIDAEMAFQRSGHVADEQIKAIGKQTGVAYICIFTLAKEQNELVVNSDIINVVTGRIENSDFVVLLNITDRADVMQQCTNLAYNLLGISAGGVSSSRTSTNTSTNNAGKLTITANGVTFDMIFVQGGTYNMGCTSEQGSCYSNEKPAHQVTVSNFYMGKFEVTQLLWRAVMGSNPSNFKGDNLPVEMVSWNDCQDFIRELSRVTGRQFRLPTEAEWEYAARGGNKTTHAQYAGGHSLYNVGWFTDNSGSRTQPVGGKLANELGIHDMSGNVWEWCSDWYDGGYYSGSPVMNPQGSSSGSSRVLRGGSWSSGATNCRVTLRGTGTPTSRYGNSGFRLVLIP